MKSRLFFVLYTAVCFPAAAQSILSDQNATLAAEFAAKFRADSIKAAAIAKTNDFPLFFVDENGVIVGFDGFSVTGMMEFKRTFNADAGTSVGVQHVWPGGSTGTSLTGILPGNRLGIWDGGGVRLTHQEFGGRVTQVDGAPATSGMHPSHVAGTMIAKGVEPDAKGMAYEASLRAYDFNNDNSEMTNAAAGGMLISNHSYGAVAGWYSSGGEWFWYGDVRVSETEDYRYGFYDTRAANWDKIALNNPYYLIVKAAGNDRGRSHTGSHKVMINNRWETSTKDRDAVGPYDCLASYAVAKNILTVGAVRKLPSGWTKPSDVEMTDYSGWGPTDDGRIKPDLVAPGHRLRSATDADDDSYGNANGTSMATPVVSGSLALVQEQFFDMHQRYMRAATLKAVAIHTTDEAGSATGPDYEYGWGLLNVPRAVGVVIDPEPHVIQERVLNNRDSFTQSYYSDGTNPARITISWTDPAGTPVEPALDPKDLMLVNDLDIKLVRKEDGVVFRPYILNPARPDDAATTGDNIRDNVEQIYIAAPKAGGYRLIVSHKAELNQGLPQAYSLVVTGFETVAPIAGFKIGSAIGCVGAPVKLVDTSLNDPHSWTWRINNGANNFTDSVAQPQLIFSSPGTYTITAFLKVANYAGEDSIEQTVTVQIFDRPEPTSISGNNHSIAHKEEVYQVDARPWSVYQWTIENGTVQTGQGSNEVTVKWGNFLSGRVSVQEMDSRGCFGDTAVMDITLEWATGINDAESTNMELYPNPASENLNVRLFVPFSQHISISITDLLGRVVKAENWDLPAGDVVKSIDLQGVNSGMYLVQLETATGSKVQKIAIE